MIDDAISVVMPTYNRGHLISRAIESCLGQLEERDELIIIDDGSTDDTERFVARYGNRLRYIRTPNQGAGAARNRGIQEARKPLLAFIDSDDEWLPGKIELQRAFMQAMPDGRCPLLLPCAEAPMTLIFIQGICTCWSFSRIIST
jgi:glycosyltransferase involved in cell wall biosynthesis